jgi:Chloroplast import apparatus Tic20-like
MAWRGSTTVSDRIFACLVYLLPLLDLINLVGRPLILTQSFLSPVLRVIAIPLSPLLAVYGSLGGIVSFIVFFALFLLVVRNESIAHFIRFNTMQAILFGIVLSLVGLIWGYVLAPILGSSLFLTQTLFNTIFLGMIAAVGFSVIQSALGKYAEIPTISEAVYMQVR